MINIIIPIYNVEKYLERCLDSVKAQNSKEFKAILVNDGSTDKSEEICRRYVDSDDRFILLNKENGGVTSAIKYGVKNSPQCDYFTFLDADDKFEKDAIKEIETIIKENDYDIISFDFFINYGDKRIKKITSFFKEGKLSDSELKKLKNRCFFDTGIVPARWNKVVKSNIVDKTVECVDEKIIIAEDLLFTALNLNQANSFYYLGKPLIHYYQNEMSAMNKFKDEYFESYKLVYALILKYIGNKDLAFRVYFQNIKTLIQMTIINLEKITAKHKLVYVLNDELTKKILIEYKPTRKKDKILRRLMLKKRIIILRVLTRINK